MILLVKKLLEEAIKKCYSLDKILIDNSMEQASVARIFYYMQELVNNDSCYSAFLEFNIDCEYNKQINMVKITQRCTKGTRPDLIIHKWGIINKNILVVEFKPRKATYKKDENTGKYLDEIKLEDFTRSGDGYEYKLGVLVKLHKRKAKFIYFQHGEEVQEDNIVEES